MLKKYSLILLILLPLSTSASLVAHYSFDNGSLNDISGYGLVANCSVSDQANPPIFENDSLRGDVIRLNGTSYLNILGSDTIQKFNKSGNISISAWVKPNGTKNEWNYEAIVTKGFDWRLEEGGVVSYRIDGVDNGVTLSGGPNIKGEWHHIVAILDDDNKKIFIDGVLIGQQSIINTIVPSNDTIQIGARKGNDIFDGLIDDVRIYNHGLSEYQIRALCNDLKTPNNDLVGTWDFNGNFYDKSSYANNLDEPSLVGNPTIINDPIRGNVLNLDGASYLDCGDMPEYSSTGKITVMAWVKPDKSAGSWYYEAIMSKGFEWRLEEGGGASYRADCIDNGTNLTGGPYLKGEWHHVTAVYDGHKKELYVDGIRVGLQYYYGTITDTDWPLQIGARLGDAKFQGQIDDVRLYNRGLTSNEIKNICSSSKGINSNLVGYWDFNGNAYDKSDLLCTNANYVGDATIINDEIRGNVLSVNGNGYLKYPHNSKYDITDQITISAWVKAEDEYGYGSIITKGTDWRLDKAHTGVSSFYLGGVTDNESPNSSENINGTWHHITVIYDGGKKYFYVDGEFKKWIYANGAITNGNNDINIGSRNNGEDNFKGLIDDVRVYNTALSQEDVAILASDYFVSNSGSDENDGKSPETSWKTIKRVNKAAVKATNTFSFNRGDTWRDDFLHIQGKYYDGYVKYNSYGSGPKPIILGSKKIDGSELWTRDVFEYNSTTHVKVTRYSIVLKTPDVGNIISTDPEIECWKKFTDKHYASYGKTFIYENDRLYLSTSEPIDMPVNQQKNPCEYYGKEFEVVLGRSGILIEDSKNVIIDDFEVKNCGTHGIYIGTTITSDTSSNIDIKNCTISYCGGILFKENQRGGNGVEIYGNANKILVEKCNISQIYDDGVSNQNVGAASHKNITYRNNIINNCEISYAYWIDSDAKNGEMKNIVFENNTCYNAGYVWSHNQRSADNQEDSRWGTHVQWTPTGTALQENIIFRNNIFYRSKGPIFHINQNSDYFTSNTILCNNIYFKNDVDTFSNIRWDATTLFNFPTGKIDMDNYSDYKILMNDYTSQYSQVFLEENLFDIYNNFKLVQNSPCINAGLTDQNIDYSKITDFSGNYRVKGNSIDIGAQESNF